MDWYSGAVILEAEFIINQTLLDEKGYPPELSSQWLYDRPRSLFQLYFLTGLSKYSGKKTIVFVFSIELMGAHQLICW